MATWKKVIVSGSSISQLSNDSGYIASTGGGIVSSSVEGDAQGQIKINGVNVDANALGTGDSPTFVTVTAALTGNASTATKLATARAFTTTGDVVITSTNFDGSGNFTAAATIQAGAVENSMFASTTKTAISGAFTDVSASLAADIASLEAAVGTGGTLFSGSAQVVMTGDVTGTAAATTVGKVQGVALTTDEMTQVANIGSTTISSTQWGYVGDADQNVRTSDSPTFVGLTLTGDLTVQGTTTALNTTNLNVEDQFILINSGAVAADGGLVVNGAGAAIGWDESEKRFALDFADATFDQATIGTDAFVAAVVTTDDPNYQKVGNIRLDNEDIYIYS
jgi:hypothetical protein